VYAVPVEQAFASRLMAARSRLLALPNLMARVLLMKTSEQLVAELTGHMCDALKQLRNLDASELLCEGAEVNEIADLPEEHSNSGVSEEKIKRR
jgi:hypothetical protein